MLDLTKLRVSLTKHGAHKVLTLLEKFHPDKVVPNTWDKFGGIKIDAAQARKNLSAFADDKLPGFWSDAKSRGSDTLRQLVFLAIAFSHHSLIEALQRGSTGNGKGKIVRDLVLRGKAFTNFKNDLEDLGLATLSDATSVSYDFTQLLGNAQLGDLAAQLIALKLSEAGWSGTSALAQESLAIGLHRALSFSDVDFRKWLTDPTGFVRDEDELPDTTDQDEELVSPFNFQSGHIPRKGGTVGRRVGRNASAKLLHNEIQSVLYDLLVDIHGKPNVGTELKTGSSGTSVDLVVRNGTAHEFYEIKTSPSLKKCIRQALSQLIEYAYWPSASRASKLVIVSEAKITKDGTRFLKHLRSIGIPLHYRQIDMVAKKISTEI
jgi:hypothetical protein